MIRVSFACLIALTTAVETLAVAPAYQSVEIEGIPHVRQKPDFCGEACAEMYLRFLGRDIDQDAVFDQSGLDPVLGRGCYTRDLAKALKAIGFDVGPVWNRIAAAKADAQLSKQFGILYRDLADGIPSIICTHFSDRPNATEHFRLIVGYDAGSDEVIYHDPAVENGASLRMSRAMLLKLWPLKYDPNEWTLIRMPLEPKRLVRISASSGFTDADFAQHVMTLKKKLPGPDFTIVLQKPFVVVGDEDPDTVRKRSVSTIKWAVDRIKLDYFEKDPDEIIDVWLFKDKDSYETNAKSLFRRKPTTPFGYYSSSDRALVMNISTGGGTLVHEIVHPFIAANFPQCPSWFNEGLASLYEQCGDRNGHITGFTNWRLRGLQQAIEKNKVPSFKSLCSTTTSQFYNEDRGTNYAQARYLCYYLQQKNLLVKFYHAFHDAVKTDPTGYGTLRKILGRDDMDAFQKEWEAYVMKLR